MPRYAPNKMPAELKRRYFELIRRGCSGAAAAEQVGVSLSCGSLWFIDAGRVSFVETSISPRYLSQDDRIEIADGLGRGEPIKQIAARIGKCYQTIYRELARNRKVDGRYQPWFAHNQAYLRRRRARLRRFAVDAELREVVAGKLAKHWSPAQISRWLRRRYRRRRDWHVCTETIYEAVYRGLIVPIDRQNLRTGRTYHRRRSTVGDRHPGRAQVSNHSPRPIASEPLSPIRRRRAHRRVQQTARRATAHVDLGPGQRDVPPSAHRTADRTADLLRRPALALAAAQQRERQRPAAAVPAEGDRPGRLDRRRARPHRRRAQRSSTALPLRPDIEPSHATMGTTAKTTMIRNDH